ncbi:MAG: hypothetical protein QOF45_2415 [Gaiellaceae bacterium]|jgi:DNA-binding NtrC family response regulator|nr:hypothetical protein [Gaiellaceae bacterium]
MVTRVNDDRVTAAYTTVLLVEDNDMVRTLLTRALERADHRVLTAADAERALALVEDYEHHIDVVVSDVRLPSMGGVEFAEELRRRDPELPVLLIGGFDTAATGFPELEKPFTLDALQSKIAEIVH